MKIIKNLTFGALAVLAATLLCQTPATQANDNGRGGNQNEKGDRDHHDRNPTVTFTKWITSDPNLPGLLETLEGVVGGDIGRGTFKGEVLKETVVGDLDEVVAFYHFNGSKHSFSAIIHLEFSIAANKGIFVGVGHSPAFQATFEIDND